MVHAQWAGCTVGRLTLDAGLAAAAAVRIGHYHTQADDGHLVLTEAEFSRLIAQWLPSAGR